MAFGKGKGKGKRKKKEVAPEPPPPPPEPVKLAAKELIKPAVATLAGKVRCQNADASIHVNKFAMI
jgi:hypothetical protein